MVARIQGDKLGGVAAHRVRLLTHQWHKYRVNLSHAITSGLIFIIQGH